MPTALSSEASARREALRQFHVAAAAERRHRRPLGERRAFSRATRPPSWSTDTHGGNSGSIRGRLEGRLGDLFGLGDVAREQDDATQADSPGQRPQLRWNLVAVEPCNQQLTDLAAKGARRHGRDSISGETGTGLTRRDGDRPMDACATSSSPPCAGFAIDAAVAATVVLTLMLGIGANSAIFSAVGRRAARGRCRIRRPIGSCPSTS